MSSDDDDEDADYDDAHVDEVLWYQDAAYRLGRYRLLLNDPGDHSESDMEDESDDDDDDAAARRTAIQDQLCKMDRTRVEEEALAHAYTVANWIGKDARPALDFASMARRCLGPHWPYTPALVTAINNYACLLKLCDVEDAEGDMSTASDAIEALQAYVRLWPAMAHDASVLWLGQRMWSMVEPLIALARIMRVSAHPHDSMVADLRTVASHMLNLDPDYFWIAAEDDLEEASVEFLGLPARPK